MANGDAPTFARAAFRVARGREWIVERCWQMDNPVPTPTAVVRTSLQHRVGGYRPDSPYAGDLEMWLRLAAYAHIGPAVDTLRRLGRRRALAQPGCG